MVYLMLAAGSILGLSTVAWKGLLVRASAAESHSATNRAADAAVQTGNLTMATQRKAPAGTRHHKKSHKGKSGSNKAAAGKDAGSRGRQPVRLVSPNE